MTAPITVSLAGSWQLLPADVFRQGFYPLDDAAWLEQEIPAHWQQHPLLASYAGNMVYRKHFNLPDPPSATSMPQAEAAQALLQRAANSRYWLRLNGIFYWSQPYFNGVDLGRHEGYFAPQEHEVTPWIANENTLIIEVACPDEHNKLGKRMITGVFSHWDCLDPATNPGGIWLPIELIITGPTRIQELQLQTSAMGDSSAELRYHVTLNSTAACDVTLRWTLTPKNFAGEVQEIEQQRTLSGGAQELSGLLDVRDPQIWWTHDLGHPNCYTVSLAVIHGDNLSDQRAVTFGIRRFEMDNWIAYLNGVRLFIKGNNYAPSDTRLATITRERLAEDLHLAQACHMNMLRVHGHIDHPWLYEAADLAGVLIWQDFPLQWLYRHEVLSEAKRQAEQMVRLLYNHPSVVIWCMHNEPIYIVDTKNEHWYSRLRTYASVFLPEWNRSVMDSQLKAIAMKADPTRWVVRSSGEYPIPGVRKGTDTHFYFGWYKIYGKLHSFEQFARRMPKLLSFVTEFGTQSFPNVESCLRFMDADIRNIDWDHLVARYHFQGNVLSQWVDWRNARSLEELVELTQKYQIEVNRFFIDRLRLRKYRPTGGIVPFMFHDSNPAIQWSIVDYWRVPKRSYAAMQLAFSPQYLFSVIDQVQHKLGSAIELPIYVVNDAQRAVPVEVTARLNNQNGAELTKIERAVTLPADCMAMELDRLRLTPDYPGTYRLLLEMRSNTGTTIVAHAYEIAVG